MNIISVPNLKEIKTQVIFLQFIILCEEEKCEENWAISGKISDKVLKQFPSILIYDVVYM